MRSLKECQLKNSIDDVKTFGTKMDSTQMIAMIRKQPWRITTYVDQEGHDAKTHNISIRTSKVKYGQLKFFSIE